MMLPGTLLWTAGALIVTVVFVVAPYLRDMNRAYERVRHTGDVIPSALLLAVLHPERMTSLALISCGVVPLSTPDQARANQKGETLTPAFKFDLPYWVISKLFKRRFMELIGADESAIAAPGRRLVERLFHYMNPPSLRSAGVAFDNRATLPGARIAAITAPTMISHAKNDALQRYHNAVFAVSTIPDASLMPIDRGGHILLVLEQSSIRSATRTRVSP